MHNYTCQICGEVSACELSSIQHLTPSGRVGVDFYNCLLCKGKYVIGEDRKPQITKHPYKWWLNKIGKEALDRYNHPEKYIEEKKVFRKKQKEEQKAFAKTPFAKALKKGLSGK